VSACPAPAPCRHKFFNTNNLWVNLCKLKATLDGSGAPMPLSTPLLLLPWLPCVPALPPGNAYAYASGNWPLICITLHCAALRCVADGVLALPLIKNKKTVNPRDSSSPPVFQLVRAPACLPACLPTGLSARLPACLPCPVSLWRSQPRPALS
jgi:hypothetical protein